MAPETILQPNHAWGCWGQLLGMYREEKDTTLLWSFQQSPLKLLSASIALHKGNVKFHLSINGVLSIIQDRVLC
jgi:hypothetical protein